MAHKYSMLAHLTDKCSYILATTCTIPPDYVLIDRRDVTPRIRHYAIQFGTLCRIEFDDTLQSGCRIELAVEPDRRNVPEFRQTREFASLLADSERSESIAEFVAQGRN